MHMADALVSVAVGGTMMAASAAIVTNSVKKLNKDMDEKKIPLMGVLGAFIFAAQMINFSIPGTGSSGHLAGALILAIILGPYAGFLTMASVLIIQALMFADGGLLALGCNIFNLAFYTCFIAYPFIYRPLTRKTKSFFRILTSSLLASIIGIQMSAFSVVIQTLLSGKTELPFGRFLLLMQPIHFAIAIVEGIVTAAVVMFVIKTRPEIIDKNEKIKDKDSLRNVIVTIFTVAIIIGGIFSWLASSDPDGLEWSIFNASGEKDIVAEGNVHIFAENIQEKTSLLPDYSLSDKELVSEKVSTSIAGITGVVITLFILVLAGIIIKRKKRKAMYHRGK